MSSRGDGSDDREARTPSRETGALTEDDVLASRVPLPPGGVVEVGLPVGDAAIAGSRTSGFYLVSSAERVSLHVLILEPDETHAASMRRALRDVADRVVYVTLAASVEDATTAMRAKDYDVVVARSPGGDDDLPLVERLLALSAGLSECAILLIGDDPSVDRAVEACRRGAQEYLVRDELSHRTLARSIRCAHERACRTQRLIEDAYHDELTHVANRRMLRRRFAEARYRAVRTRGTIGLLMIDLDGFKEVNDTLGHAAGDELLVTVAARLVANVRASDVVARVGGDEFVVLADGTDGAPPIAELRARIDRALRDPFMVQGFAIAVHASVGGASTTPDGECELSALLRAADGEMYRAKVRRAR